MESNHGARVTETARFAKLNYTAVKPTFCLELCDLLKRIYHKNMAWEWMGHHKITAV